MKRVMRWEGLKLQSFTGDFEGAKVTVYGIGESSDKSGGSIQTTGQEI